MKQSFLIPAVVVVLLIGAGLFFVFSKKQELTIVPGQQVVSPERKTYTKNIYLQGGNQGDTVELSPTLAPSVTPTSIVTPSVTRATIAPTGTLTTAVSPTPSQAKSTVTPTAVKSTTAPTGSVSKKTTPPVTGSQNIFMLIGGIVAIGLIAISFVL